MLMPLLILVAIYCLQTGSTQRIESLADPRIFWVPQYTGYGVQKLERFLPRPRSLTPETRCSLSTERDMTADQHWNLFNQADYVYIIKWANLFPATNRQPLDEDQVQLFNLTAHVLMVLKEPGFVPNYTVNDINQIDLLEKEGDLEREDRRIVRMGSFYLPNNKSKTENLLAKNMAFCLDTMRYNIAYLIWGEKQQSVDQFDSEYFANLALIATPIAAYDKSRRVYLRRFCSDCALPSVQMILQENPPVYVEEGDTKGMKFICKAISELRSHTFFMRGEHHIFPWELSDWRQISPFDEASKTTTMTVSPIHSFDNGSWSCEVTNVMGSTVTHFDVIVRSRPPPEQTIWTECDKSESAVCIYAEKCFVDEKTRSEIRCICKSHYYGPFCEFLKKERPDHVRYVMDGSWSEMVKKITSNVIITIAMGMVILLGILMFLWIFVRTADKKFNRELLAKIDQLAQISGSHYKTAQSSKSALKKSSRDMPRIIEEQEVLIRS